MHSLIYHHKNPLLAMHWQMYRSAISMITLHNKWPAPPSQRGANTFPAFACIMSAKSPLARANHMGVPRVEERGSQRCPHEATARAWASKTVTGKQRAGYREGDSTTIPPGDQYLSTHGPTQIQLLQKDLYPLTSRLGSSLTNVRHLQHK